MNIGTLEIQLRADMTRLVKDMDQAKSVVGSAMAEIERTVNLVKGAIAGLAGGLSVAAFASMVKGSIEAAAELDHLSKKTGAAVEALSALKGVAKLSGTDLDSVGTGLTKLSKSMLEATQGSGTAGSAFKSLKLNVLDSNGQLKDSGNFMQEVAKRLFEMENGTQRAAYAQEIFGKSGAQLLPMLHDLAEAGTLQGKITAEQAHQAAMFEQQLTKLKGGLNGIAMDVATGILPSLNDLVGMLVEAKKQSDELQKGVKGLKENGSLEDWADDAAIGIARLIDVLKIVPNLFKAAGMSMAVVASDIDIMGKKIALLNAPMTAARVARGEHPIDELKASIAARDQLLQEANQKWSDLWNKPANQMEQAMIGRILGRNTPGEDAIDALGKLWLGKKGDRVSTGAVSELQKLLKTIEEKTAVEKLDAQTQGDLTEGQKFAVKVMSDLRDGTLDLTTKEKKLLGAKLEDYLASEQLNKANKDAEKATLAAAEAHTKFIGSLQDGLSKMKADVLAQRDAIDRLGLNREAIAALDAAKLEEQATTLDGIAIKQLDKNLDETQYDLYKAQAAELRKLADLKKFGAAKETAIEQEKKATEGLIDVWKSIDSTAHDTFVSIFHNGKSAFDRLRDTLKNGLLDLLYQMTLKRWIFSIGASVSGIPEIANAANSIGSGGIAGAISNATGLSSLLGFGQLEAGASLTGGVSTLASGATAFSDAAFTASQSIATGATSGFMAGLQSAVAAVPGWGWALAGAALLYKGFNGGETRQGGQYGYAFDGQTLYNNRRGSAVSGATTGVNFLEGPSGGEIAGTNIRTAVTATVTGINDLLKQLGSSASLVGFQAALESSGEGRGGVFAGGTLSTGATFGQSGQGDNYAGTLFDKAFSNSPDSAQALKDFSTELKQTTLQALQAATDIPKSIADQLAKVDVKSLTDQAATDLLTSITSEITAVNQLRDALGALPPAFANLKNLSFDAADSLIKAAGSLQNLTSGISYFAQNFYTDAEKTAGAQADLNKQLASLGYAGITTKDQLRAVVEGLDLTTAADQKTYASLLKLAPEFVQVTDSIAKAAQDAAAAQQQAADAAAKAQQQYWQKYQQSLDSARSAVSDAYNRESSALQETITKSLNYAATLRDFNQSLLTGNLSTLSPGSQYQTLKDQFDKTYSLAKAGDPASIGNLQGVAQKFLEASKGYNASSTAYTNDFSYVRTALEATARTADTQADIARAQLGEMQKSVAGILDLNKSEQSLADAIKQFMGIRAAAEGGSMGAAGIGPMSVFGGGLGDVNDATKLKMVQGWYAANPSANKNPAQDDLNYWADKLTSGVGATDIQMLFNKVVAQNTGTAYNPYDLLVGSSVDQDKVQMLRQQYASGLIDEHGNLIDGSHLNGLDRVPHDGYIAQLHARERVKTAKQADAEDAGNKEVATLLRQMLVELRADKPQRAAIADKTLKKLDSVATGLDGNRRVLARKEVKA
jgi:hypothetical protein